MKLVVISLSLICVVLLFNQLRMFYAIRQRRRRNSSSVTDLLSMSPGQLLTEIRARDQRLAAQVKESLDHLSGLPKHNNDETFRKELHASVRAVHRAADQLYPFVLEASGLTAALVSRKTYLQQHYPLQIDLATYRAVRFEASQEWVLYQFIDALLLRSIEADDSAELHIKLHISFFNDHITLRYYDEASPLPPILALSSSTETTVAPLRFWLYLLQTTPVVRSQNEWFFRVPIRPVITQQNRLGFA